MSWLRRTGTGRNNIAWGGGATTSGNYLRRTSTGRNNISYINISTSGTHKLLERYSTSRNNIRWNNLTFSFGPDLSRYPLYTLYYGQGNYNPYNITWRSGSTYNRYICRTVNNNGYLNISEVTSADTGDIGRDIVIFYQKGVAQNAYNEILKSTNVTINGATNTGTPFSYSAKPVKSFSTTWTKEIRIILNEYDDYDYITLNCDRISTPGQFPNLYSITFS